MKVIKFFKASACHMELLQPRHQVKPSNIGDLLIYESQKMRNKCLVGTVELQRLQMNHISELIKHLNFMTSFEFLLAFGLKMFETCFNGQFVACPAVSQINRPTDTEHCTLSADRANNTPSAQPAKGLSSEHSARVFSEECVFRFCSLNLSFSGLRDYS